MIMINIHVLVWLQSALGWEHQTELSKHGSQTDAAKGFGGKYGVQRDRQDQVHLYMYCVLRHSLCLSSAARWVPCVCFCSSWPTIVDRIKDLWCSSTDRLLSIQVYNYEWEGLWCSSNSSAACYQHRQEWILWPLSILGYA